MISNDVMIADMDLEIYGLLNMLPSMMDYGTQLDMTKHVVGAKMPRPTSSSSIGD